MQDLDKFKNEMNLSGQNVYVGHRYVPKIIGEWDKTIKYEPLSIVIFEGDSFTSRQWVPENVDINNDEYWVSTGNYNAQVEYYRQEVKDVKVKTDNNESNIATLTDEIVESRNGFESLKLFHDDLDSRIDENTEMLNNAKSEYLTLDDRLNDGSVSPDEFTGNDLERVQKAIDFALDNQRSVKFSRMYDITGLGHILINKLHNERAKNLILKGEGGGIKKEDSGYIFNTNYELTGDINLVSMVIQSKAGGGTIVWNDKIIRVHEIGTIYRYVDHYFLSTENYMQSYNLTDVSIVGGNDSFIKTPAAFDVVFTGGFCEHRMNFFEQVPHVVGAKFTRLVTVTFRDFMVEGLKGFAYKFRNLTNVTIDGAYFEKNVNDIIVESDADVMNLNILNSTAMNTTNTMVIIKARYPMGVKIQNVFTTNTPIVDVTSVLGANRVIIENSNTDAELPQIIGDKNRVLLITNYNYGGTEETGYYVDTGWVKKTFTKANITIPGNTYTTFLVPMHEKINIRRDTAFSVNLQPFSTGNTEHKKIIVASYTTTTDNNLKVTIKSEETNSLPASLFVVAMTMFTSPG